MATLSPLGLLLIFIALSAAPPSATNVTVHLSEYSRLTFARNVGGWWVRPDDTGASIYHKREGTNLLIKSASFQEETTDMAFYFELTGVEDWSQPLVIRGKFFEKKADIKTRMEKNRMVVVSIVDGTTGESIITWDTSKK